MGLLDPLLGRTRVPEAKTDSLFAITTAAVAMESEFGLKPDGLAAICFKPMESSKYDSARSEIDDILKLSMTATGTKYRIEKDNYEFLWIRLEDRDFEDLVTVIHMISQTLIDQGFGTQLLCAVYRFQGENTVYWIYSFKQGRFYPFVPQEGQKRKTSLEFRLKALLENELPVEKDMEKWYPLWGMPI